MEKQWREENERIMRLHPSSAPFSEAGEPDTMPPVADLEAGEEELPPEKRPLP